MNIPLPEIFAFIILALLLLFFCRYHWRLIMKPGIKTSEFWITTIVNVAMAVFGILVYRGLFTQEEADLWVQLVSALSVGLIPLAMAYMTAKYSLSRAEVKANA